MPYCVNCGVEVGQDHSFCQKCGSRNLANSPITEVPTKEEPERARPGGITLLALIAILVGVVDLSYAVIVTYALNWIGSNIVGKSALTIVNLTPLGAIVSTVLLVWFVFGSAMLLTAIGFIRGSKFGYYMGIIDCPLTIFVFILFTLPLGITLGVGLIVGLIVSVPILAYITRARQRAWFRIVKKTKTTNEQLSRKNST